MLAADKIIVTALLMCVINPMMVYGWTYKEKLGSKHGQSTSIADLETPPKHIIEDGSELVREKKILNLFDVVRFPNGACMSSSAGKNGTCYARDECENKGGTGYGSCAGGYGVCCVFTLTCGQTSTENCSYFQSTGAEIGQCRVKICPCREHICQLRLDFASFTINSPNNLAAGATPTVTKNYIANKPGEPGGQCLMDTFMVTSPGNPTPPVICGINTGEHMYVDASELCNDLAFALGPTTTEEMARAGVVTAATRSWNIKITQYDCDYENLAPDGCTQYYWGVTSNVVRTYNYAGSRHLADQNQNICIRRERGVCRICWTEQDETVDFQLSGSSAAGGNGYSSSQCCGYGVALTKITNGYDCVMIPGASKGATKSALLAPGAAYGFCGGQLINGVAATIATVCSQQTPFSIRFLSDHYEHVAEDIAGPVGFRLTYITSTC